jgi:DNA replication licensing factor MCM4
MRGPIQQNIDNDGDDEQFERLPYYIEKLKEVRELELNVLDVDCSHIFSFDAQLYRQIEDYPTDLIPIFDLVVSQVYKELDMYNLGGEQNRTEDHQEEIFIQVRPHNLKKTYRIRELGPEHIDKMVTLRGIIIRNGDVVPEMKQAAFRCTNCNTEEQRYIERGRVIEPLTCIKCQAKHSFELMHNMCLFSDKQHVKVQETPESVPEGETPQTIHLCAYEDLVDFVRPGDRVEITGIYKAMGIRVNANKRVLKNVYRTYVDVMNYVKADKHTFDIRDKKEDKNGDVEMQEAHGAVAAQALN